MASFSPLTRFSPTHSKPHLLITHNINSKSNSNGLFFTLTLRRPNNLPLFSLSPLKASSGTSDPAATAVIPPPPPENSSVGTNNGSASAVAAVAEEEVKGSVGFVDPRWVGGTWDLKQFRKNGSTDWDAVIDAGNIVPFPCFVCAFLVDLILSLLKKMKILFLCYATPFLFYVCILSLLLDSDRSGSGGWEMLKHDHQLQRVN